MKLVAITLAATALAVAAAGTAARPAPAPAATPFVLGTFQPYVVGSPPPLPNIGRTRSVTPACSAMRDLVIPSFAAAQRADKLFVETRKRLPAYADVADDPSHQDDAYRQMLLSKLDADVTALMQENLVLNRALGDPRLAADKNDPQVAAERRGLQELYDAQATRASMLSEFVIREHAATAKQGLEDNGAFTPRQLAPYGINTAPPIPTPALTAPPGMPLRSGIPLADKNSLADWGTSIAVFVRTNENLAAKRFLPIANGCR